MFRPKYFIYIPLVIVFVTLIWLLSPYITGCHSSWNKTLIEQFEKDFNKKALTIQRHIQSLLEREKRQNQLLTAIENLKNSVHEQLQKQNASRHKSNPNLPYIYAITPTYERLTQKADLTRLCQTFQHISNFHWIIVEDADSTRDLIERFLKRCDIKYTYLAIRTKVELQRAENEPRWKKARGVEQRNAGLAWLRKNVQKASANGVVYFIDDDNTYDLELFEQMRWTKKVSIWPVGLVGGLKWEGPVCENGKVIKFWTAWDFTRPFPIDMAGFAINIKLLLDNPSVVIDINAPQGHLESSLLRLLVTKDELEPLADNCKKILVWHTQTADPKMKQEIRLRKLGQQSDPSIEV